jgi:hypothetical protein
MEKLLLVKFLSAVLENLRVMYTYLEPKVNMCRRSSERSSILPPCLRFWLVSKRFAVNLVLI